MHWKEASATPERQRKKSKDQYEPPRIFSPDRPEPRIEINQMQREPVKRVVNLVDVWRSVTTRVSVELLLKLARLSGSLRDLERCDLGSQRRDYFFERGRISLPSPSSHLFECSK